MSRIRSVHPGLFTDESFASVSMAARMLIIGLWTEAWDDGVFEWKPLTIKMRIFPADSLKVEPLLDELVAAGVVCEFEYEGKRRGAIRNFCKFQRPKKPNSSGELPTHISKFVAFTAISSEPVRDQFGTSSEIAVQMEDGGCNSIEIDKSISKNITPPEASPLAILSECLTEQTAKDLITHRQAKRTKLTPRAARELVKAFRAYGNPEAAAAEMMLRGWTGFKPEWMRETARAGPNAGERSGVAKLLAEAYGIDGRNRAEAANDFANLRQIPVFDGGERTENYSDDGGLYGRLLVGDSG